MAISLKHNFQSAVADGGDTSLVQPSNWNAEHNLTLATARLIGRTSSGTGSAEEISVGTGLNLSSGSLAVSSTTPQVNSINTFTASQVIEVTDNSNPALRITQLGTADALRVEDETSPDATPFVITAAGHAIAGYGSTLTIETVVPQFQSHTATLDEGGFGGVDWGATSTGQVNWFGKSRGGSYGSQAIVQDGDTIGDFRFYGSDGTALIPAARLQVAVDGTPGTSDMPGRISFFTTADGASTATERFRIGNAGQWGIGGATYGTSGQAFISGGSSAAPSWGTLGIAGGGTGQTTASAAANALDGYLEIVASAGTTTLTNTSARNIVVTGSTSHTIRMPDVTTLSLGWTFTITNLASSTVTLQSSGANNFVNPIGVSGSVRLVCIATTGTTTASWSLQFTGANNRSGSGNLVFSSNAALTTPTIAQISGGSAASSTLTLQSTSGAGTTDAIIFRTASQSERFRIDTSGALGIGGANYGTSTQYMKSGGTGAAPSWSTISNTDISGLGTMSTQAANNVAITGGSITGITDLVVADGGTGSSSFTAYSVITGGTTSTGALQSVSGVGTSGQVLTSNGASALPTWQSVPSGLTLIQTDTFDASGTYNVPAGADLFKVHIWGAGGSGGRGTAGTAEGGGGGGGAFLEAWFNQIYLAGATTLTVTVGAGGASRTTNNSGAVGGNSSIGSGGNFSGFIAYGGGGGGQAGGGGAGGGGGGSGGSGASAGGTGASLVAGAAGSGSPLQAVKSILNTDKQLLFSRVYYGLDKYAVQLCELADTQSYGPGTKLGLGVIGAAGNTATAAAQDANTGTDEVDLNTTKTIYGGAGGGAGRDGTGSATTYRGGNATYGGAGGGGAASNTTGGNGGTSTYGGNGGAGAFDANNAVAGSQPGGGGGGSESGNSGAGGDGRVIIYAYKMS